MSKVLQKSNSSIAQGIHRNNIQGAGMMYIFQKDILVSYSEYHNKLHCPYTFEIAGT